MDNILETYDTKDTICIFIISVIMLFFYILTGDVFFVFACGVTVGLGIANIINNMEG